MELTPYAIFDMDGTLLHSTEMWDGVTDRVLARYGKALTREQRLRTVTYTIEAVGELLVREAGVPLTAGECAALIRAEAADGYAHRSTVREGVPQVLAAMHARGVRMGVASGTEKALVDAALTAHGLRHWFEFTVDCKNPDGKARPDVYLEALHRFGASDPSRAAVFEDSEVGLATAKAAGFVTVGVYDAPMAEAWPRIAVAADFAAYTWQEWLDFVERRPPLPKTEK